VVYDGLEMADSLYPYDVAEVRAELGLSSDDFVVGNVGRLVAWKGQDVFIHALAEIAHKVPNLKALIVGRPDRGKESYLDELKTLATACGLAQRVVFTGFRLDVPRLLAAMDVVVHSSSSPEPFGLVVIEGMAAGKPVVATRAGGPLDSLRVPSPSVLLLSKVWLPASRWWPLALAVHWIASRMVLMAYLCPLATQRRWPRLSFLSIKIGKEQQTWAQQRVRKR
jgi:hypothetical protein